MPRESVLSLELVTFGQVGVFPTGQIAVGTDDVEGAKDEENEAEVEKEGRGNPWGEIVFGGAPSSWSVEELPKCEKYALGEPETAPKAAISLLGSTLEMRVGMIRRGSRLLLFFLLDLLLEMRVAIGVMRGTGLLLLALVGSTL